ncbi:ribonuclease HII [Helicobacter cetorum]|uniref:ribonuclease HII n=1 Tax=Helicobacter cetorum TaxID=138563 RepID=UPI000CF09EF8|nr:ribonuclease HII [Helicobacter cetorum]
MTLGIDEAGRGCLAGSLFVAGVVCDEKIALEFIEMGVKDSKKLTQKKRFVLEDKIKSCDDVKFYIATKSVDEIDAWGLGACLKLAIQEILENLSPYTKNIYIDGNTTFGLNQKYSNLNAIIKGDDKIIQISMASILAKTSKDREMLDLHALYPQYGWNKNCGYGTKKHMDMIRQYGITPFHRKSFTLKSSPSLFSL